MSMQEYNASHVVDNYDWKSLGQVKMVDIGGGAGHVTMELVKTFPNLSVIVQDMEKMVDEANADIPAELKDRFEFMVQDIFAPQTVQADIYFIRWVFHNWSDKYCALILKALIPALKPGARIIINETCMPEPGRISHWREKYLRQVIFTICFPSIDILTSFRTCRSFDLNMTAGFASYERSLDEWKMLLAGVDPRFVFQKVKEADDSALAIIEFIWAQED